MGSSDSKMTGGCIRPADDSIEHSIRGASKTKKKSKPKSTPKSPKNSTEEESTSSSNENSISDVPTVDQNSPTSTPTSPVQTPAAAAAEIQHSFRNLVEELIIKKKKTEDLYNAILTSEVTTDSFDGPFGRKKSKIFKVFIFRM